jgi:hypothetical protein
MGIYEEKVEAVTAEGKRNLKNPIGLKSVT